MLSAPAVLEVLQSVRERTRTNISIPLSDNDALSIALLCGLVEFDALLEYSQDRTVRTESIAAAQKLALSDSEFVTLFGTADPTAPRAVQANVKKLTSYETLEESKAMQARLEAAMATTLKEGAQLSAWRTNSIIRIATEIALFRATDALGCVSSVVGGLVRADERRLEDLKSDVEDIGLDVLIVTQAVFALSSSIV